MDAQSQLSSSSPQAFPRSDRVCSNEKSAPFNTAFAFPNASNSPSRASFRASKYFNKKSHSPCKEWMYVKVAISSFPVAAFVAALSDMDLESSALFVDDSAINVS